MPLPDGLKLLETLSPSVWKASGFQERESVIRQAETVLAASEGRNSCNVRFEELPPTVRGLYNNFPPGTIIVNKEVIKCDEPGFAVNAIAHESRHAFQWDCIDNPRKHSQITEAEREVWENDFSNPIWPSDNYREYINRVTEVDARRYAYDITHSLYPAMSLDTARAIDPNYEPMQPSVGNEPPEKQSALDQFKQRALERLERLRTRGPRPPTQSSTPGFEDEHEP